MMRLVVRSGDILQVWSIEDTGLGRDCVRKTDIWIELQIISVLYFQSWIGCLVQVCLVDGSTVVRR